MTTKKLTPKEARFCEEMLVDGNQAQAAIRSGYSERCARETAYKLMQKPHIKAAVAKALKAQQERTQLTADQVLLDMKRLGDKAEKARQYNAAINSRVWLGKHHKLWTEKLEHSISRSLEDLVLASMKPKEPDEPSGD
jgi:phage terminase small subunit